MPVVSQGGVPAVQDEGCTRVGIPGGYTGVGILGGYTGGQYRVPRVHTAKHPDTSGAGPGDPAGVGVGGYLGAPRGPVRPSHLTTHSGLAGLRGPLRCQVPLPEQRATFDLFSWKLSQNGEVSSKSV